MAENVVFIRKNGRIIPIRKSGATKKPENLKSGKVRAKNIAKGTAQVTGGAAVGYYSGKFAARSLKMAAHYENAARNMLATASKLSKSIQKAAGKLPVDQLEQLELFSKQAARHGAAGLRASTSHTRAFRLVKGVRLGGAAVAGALIASGARDLYKGIVGKKPSSEVEASAVATGIAGALASNTGFYRVTKHGSLKGWKFIKSGFMEAIDKITLGK